MVYDLRELSVLQAKLDERILKLHHIEEEKTVAERVLAFMVELGELANETRCFKYWSLKAASSEDIILEEYVDGIHFLLSLANTLGLEAEFSVEKETVSLTLVFIDVFEMASQLSSAFNEENLIALFAKYLALGEFLNFDKDKIIAGYLLKNKENHNRQSEGY